MDHQMNKEEYRSPRVLLGALLLLIMLGTYWLLFGLGVVNFRISPIQRSNLTGTETWLLGTFIVLAAGCEVVLLRARVVLDAASVKYRILWRWDEMRWSDLVDVHVSRRTLIVALLGRSRRFSVPIFLVSTSRTFDEGIVDWVNMQASHLRGRFPPTCPRCGSRQPGIEVDVNRESGADTSDVPGR